VHNICIFQLKFPKEKLSAARQVKVEVATRNPHLPAKEKRCCGARAARISDVIQGALARFLFLCHSGVGCALVIGENSLHAF